MDQLLFGEAFEVIEEEGAYVWGQARRDGYVGFVEQALEIPVTLVGTGAARDRVLALR